MHVSRRKFGQSLAAAAVATVLPAALRGQPATFCRNIGSVLDLHTHIFNALDLPINGIFASWTGLVGHPEWGRGAAAIINAIAKVREKAPPEFEAESFDQVRALEISVDAWAEKFANETPDETAQHRHVREAAQTIDVDDQTRKLFENPDARDAHRVVFSRIMRALLKAIPPEIFDAVERTEALIKAGAKWLWIMTDPSWKIASYLCVRTPEVGLYIHHLVDMDNYYPKPSQPIHPVARQVERMRAITVASGGRFLPFVAFDPQKGTQNVEEGLARGAVGVKVYPPNGYAPDKNDPNWKRLINICIRDEVPIFSHCTPSGFHPPSTDGCTSNPRLWKPILDEHPKLRLCFGHAGGEEAWLGGKSKACGGAQFTIGVLEMVNSYDNVYCEVGHLSDAPDHAAAFRSSLDAFVGQYGRLPERLCYGTDWLMPAMFIRGPKAYLDAFQKIFDTIPWKADFFSGNARKYLNLKKWLKRNAAKKAGWDPNILDYVSHFA